MPESFSTTRRVELRDTDAAGIVHFSAYFRFMEQSEHELLRHLGLSVVQQDGERTISWPRVSTHCDFLVPSRFEDVLTIRISVKRIGEKSVTYAFEFRNEDRTAARGSMTSACCEVSQRAQPRSIPIPSWIREKLSGLQLPGVGGADPNS